MKKLLLALGVATALTGTAFANGHEVDSEGATLGGSTQDVSKVQTDSHTISFEGVVSARTCKIDKSESTINLGTVSANDINEGKAPEKAVSIKLTSCGESYSDKVSVLLEPGDNSAGNGALANRLEDEKQATNAVLLVKKENSQLIDLNGDEAARTLEYKVLNDQGGNYTFNLKVQYDRTDTLGNKVRAGIFNGALPFKVVYK